MSNSKLLVTEHCKIAYSAINLLANMDLPNNPSIIFDIDNTLIDDYQVPIKPIIQIYNYCKSIFIQPIIITNRMGTHENVIYTKKQLTECGITGYNLIYFRHPNENNMWNPKIQSRKDVLLKGYNTIMSIGDKPWDIGIYGGIGVLLPTN